jgi:hypothetical protein
MICPAHWSRLVATVVLLAPLGAAAAEEIDYRAAPGCPGKDAFVKAAIQKSAGRVVGLAGAGPLKVELRATPAGYTGLLQRVPEGSDPTVAPRVLAAARCEDVVEALALTLALSLVPPVEPPGAEQVLAAAPARPPSVARAARRLSVGLGVRGGRYLNDAPMLGGALEVGLAREARSEDGWWTAGLEGRLRISWLRNDLVLAPGRARFAVLAAALELCPVHLEGRLRVGLCLVSEAGRLDGEGIEIAHPQQGRSAWLALGGAAELQLALSRRWHLAGTAQVARPLQQTRFVFADPADPVTRTAAAALAATVTLVALFP